jgi:hypothetical protein
MHLHFQSNQKKCKVRHGASNNIKYLGFSYTGIPNRIPLELWKRSRFSEGKKKTKGNARIWRVKKRKKKSTAKFGALQISRKEFLYFINQRPSFVSGNFSTTLCLDLSNKPITYAPGFRWYVVQIGWGDVEGWIINSLQVITSSLGKDSGRPTGSHQCAKVVVTHYDFVKLINFFFDAIECLRNIIGIMLILF